MNQGYKTLNYLFFRMERLMLSFKFIFKKNPVYCISFAWVAIDGVICLKTYSGRLCVYIAQTVDSEGGALCHYMRPFDTDGNAFSLYYYSEQ